MYSGLVQNSKSSCFGLPTARIKGDANRPSFLRGLSKIGVYFLFLLINIVPFFPFHILQRTAASSNKRLLKNYLTINKIYLLQFRLASAHHSLSLALSRGSSYPHCPRARITSMSRHTQHYYLLFSRTTVWILGYSSEMECLPWAQSPAQAKTNSLQKQLLPIKQKWGALSSAQCSM